MSKAEQKVLVAVLVSGGGTNLQALIDAESAGKLGNGKLALVISSSENAYALTRAKQNEIASITIKKCDYQDSKAYDEALLSALRSHDIELVVLAGYLRIIGENTLSAYENRIINVHPSLIPSFCGDGYYGLRVHEEALKRGVKVTGATVHYVNGIVDGGEILLQKAVRIYKSDTPESLQRRVMKQAEWIILPQAVRMLCESKAN